MMMIVMLTVPLDSSHLEIFALFHWKLSMVHPHLRLLGLFSLLWWLQQQKLQTPAL